MSPRTSITIEKTNRKTVIFSPYLIPSLALADPELTVDLPPHITAGTGMDAYTHNVEAYIAKGFHPICDAIALVEHDLGFPLYRAVSAAKVALSSRDRAEFRFADGDVMSYADVLAQGFDLDGTDDDDVITGTGVTDRICGFEGGDFLYGRAGMRNGTLVPYTQPTAVAIVRESSNQSAWKEVA